VLIIGGGRPQDGPSLPVKGALNWRRKIKQDVAQSKNGSSQLFVSNDVVCQGTSSTVGGTSRAVAFHDNSLYSQSRYILWYLSLGVEAFTANIDDGTRCYNGNIAHKKQGPSGPRDYQDAACQACRMRCRTSEV
jgi:hypothetical protein